MRRVFSETLSTPAAEGGAMAMCVMDFARYGHISTPEMRRRAQRLALRLEHSTQKIY